MTEKALAKRLTESYSRLTGKSFYCHESLVLYLLDKVSSPPLPMGTFRKAVDSDMYFLPFWYADFVPACHLGDYDLEAGVGKAQRSIDAGCAYIWENGTPVSTAATARRTSDCAFINQVYTPPNLRGKGYSTACVSSLSKKLLEDGFKYCALYADCANPYSNKVYKSIGYKEIFYYDQYKLKESDQDA
jgi:predicted GNAT family acetyltransferase